ncbi:unnamed protein product [Rotaria sp. Silwood1]|nr:unnamed protein product [Rotaria sp. Silwood1]CAF1682411.1 unnamed protein product [Rotaria sp. Silwood1]
MQQEQSFIEIFIIHSFEWDILLNLDDDDKLLCYSYKGNECEQITNNDDDNNKILCNKRTQLCWKHALTTAGHAVDTIVREKSPVSTEKNLYIDEEEDENVSQLKLNTSDPNSFGVNWDGILYHQSFSNRVTSISNIFLFLMPLLLVIIF